MRFNEIIRKVKGGYRLYSHSGKNLGTYDTQAGAKKRERQVQYFKHAKEDQHHNEKPAGIKNESELVIKKNDFPKMISQLITVPQKGIGKKEFDPRLLAKIYQVLTGEPVEYDTARGAYTVHKRIKESVITEGEMIKTEVVKMPPTKNSSQGMADWAYKDAQDKKVPLKGSLKGIPSEVYDMGDHLRVFVKDNQGPVLYLALHKFLDGFKSGAVAVEPRGRGKNLAVRVYQSASDTFGRPIYSDTTQTDASRIGIWQKLIATAPDRVVGYDQRTREDLPLTATDRGPAVRGNQPVYTQRTAKDLPKSVTNQNRSRTRLLKLLPKLGIKEAYQGGLHKWFKQKWVNIGKKKEGGGHPECGTSGDKKGYAKCVPASKAASMTDKQKKSAVSRKRAAQNKAGRGGKSQPGQGNKPIRVSTKPKK